MAKMRSENTESAKADRRATDAAIESGRASMRRQDAGRDEFKDERSASDYRIAKAMETRARRREDEARMERERVASETGYGLQGYDGGLTGSINEERLANSPMGVEGGRLKYAKGGLVKKTKSKPVMKMAKGGMMCSPRKKMAMGGMVKGCKRSGVK